ncbi:hypothetical protein Mmc1_3466 [Magnetococcus marinus MC-1]|uniref:Sel1 domain protein repeat-containing protein n=1 Tax=Magnetococcus marinus (strain ATCC BAA-1437 / JCM 17883 / MC-1) TaxID=156889 RepID=A0LDA8_MAGMM|nr:sel1 repeat family protein [Magnetococcus marinus]ABK45951.1 hypothetical protein Mmc1_3466 [Magnetococcus marinus MC-1]
MPRLLLALVLLSLCLTQNPALAQSRAEYLAWRAQQGDGNALPRLAQEGDINAMIATGNCLLTGQDGKQICTLPSISTGLLYWEQALLSNQHPWLANDLLELLMRGPTMYRHTWNQDWNAICRVSQYVRHANLIQNLGTIQKSGVGLCYLSNFALPQKDTPFGLKLIEQAAHDGLSEAASILADIYAKGLYGIPTNMPKSRHWHAIAQKTQ